MKLLIVYPTIVLAVLGSTVNAFEGVRDIDFPASRYQLWDSLDESLIDAAETLGYDDRTWNSPGEASIESLSYETLTEESGEWAEALEVFGYSEEQWDCYINHYEDYDWKELEEEGVVEYFEILGWSEESWSENEGAPETEDFDWEELDDEQQAAAMELCYFEETWNGVNMEDWESLPSQNGEMMMAFGIGGLALVGLATMAARKLRRSSKIDLLHEEKAATNFEAMA